MQPELDAVRRLDWRFLLPEPELDRVACVTPADSALVDALRQFAGVLSVAAPAELHATDAPYDLVVAQAPDRAALHAATGALKRGGALYLELPRPWRIAQVARRHDIDAWLSARGFDHVHRFWLWPSAAAPTLVCPLDHAASLRYAVRRRTSRKPWRSLLARGLLRLRLLHWVLGDVSLVAYQSVH